MSLVWVGHVPGSGAICPKSKIYRSEWSEATYFLPGCDGRGAWLGVESSSVGAGGGGPLGGRGGASRRRASGRAAVRGDGGECDRHGRDRPVGRQRWMPGRAEGGVDPGCEVWRSGGRLGGKTVIGREAVIGSSVWITRSVSAKTTVLLEKPQLRVRGAAKETLPEEDINFQI